MKYLQMLALLIVWVPIRCFGQNNNSSIYVWKKVVSREIIIDGSKNSTKTKKPESFAKMMGDAVIKDKVPAYSNFDMTLSQRVDISEIGCTKIDSVPVTDPITGKNVVKIVTHRFDYSIINRYRLLEEWIFDPVNYTTRIHLLGMAPVRDIYGDDGVFRGHQAMFWLHYADAKSVIDKYDRLHPTDGILPVIAREYLAGLKPNIKEGVWTVQTTQVTNMPVDTEDTKVRYLRNMNDDKKLSEMLIDAQYNGTVTGWRNYNEGLTDQLPPHDLIAPGFRRVNRTIITDPVTDSEEERTLISMYPHGSCKMKIVEDRSFKPLNGEIEARINVIAPMIEQQANNKSTLNLLFWANFSDAQKVILNYDSYHPDNSFALTLWNSYFLREVKSQP